MKASVTILFLLIGCTEEPSESPETGTLRGMYSYMADAAIFVDCETGNRYPVSFEEDHIKLEKAYLDTRTEPGKPLLVSFEGRIVMRTKMEGTGEQETVIVEHFDALLTGEDCGR